MSACPPDIDQMTTLVDPEACRLRLNRRIDLAREEACRLLDDDEFLEIHRHAREIYTPRGIRMWLDRKNSHLGDERPIDLVVAGRGSEVLALLAALTQGAFP